MRIDNIERFYEQNHQYLIEDNGRRPLRPTKSYTKDIIACFNKFQKLYKKEGVVKHTKEEFSSILEVNANTTLQNMRSMQEFGFLSGAIEVDEDNEDNDSRLQGDDVYILTTSFVELVESDIEFGAYLYERLINIRTLEDFTPYLNYLLCTLREAALYNEAISFGSISYDVYKGIVTDPSDRQELRNRIFQIYGYCGRRGPNQSVNNDNYIPNISYMSLGTLEELGLIKNNKNKNKYNLNTYSLTYPGIFLLNVLDGKILKSNNNHSSSVEYLQKIYYGAPGTGKSNEIKRLTGEGLENGMKFGKNYTFRTTFHPDSDYSSFVGAYKPIWDEEEKKITYKFRPQTFLKAYVAAWTHPKENVALVIEEINRGNCAQIFGDIFQLLDRENDGLSKYPIEADIDMQSFLKDAFSGAITESWAGIIGKEDFDEIISYYSKHYDNAFEKIKNGEILTLPKNLSILATMNTSDQSLFPMDSAFKRRWDWEYVPIVNAEKNWKIEINDEYELIDWWEFLERTNNVVAELTTSEDKQLGYFFCLPDKKADGSDELTIISAERFVGKVIFYLWNDVFKDYAFDARCCKNEDGKEVLYANFYKDGKNVNIDVLKKFFEQLKDSDDDETLVKEKPTPSPAPSIAEGEDSEGEDTEAGGAEE